MKFGYHAGSNFPEHGGFTQSHFASLKCIMDGLIFLSIVGRQSHARGAGWVWESQLSRSYVAMEHGYREDLGGYEVFVGLHLPREAQGQPTRTEILVTESPMKPKVDRQRVCLRSTTSRGSTSPFKQCWIYMHKVGRCFQLNSWHRTARD